MFRQPSWRRLAFVATGGSVALLAALAAPRIGISVTVSGPTPFAGCAAGAPPSGSGATMYVNAEVEPMVAVNPKTVTGRRENLIGVWQEDRWDSGGARGAVAASSFDGGRTWSQAPLPFTLCAPGGLPFQRASDPWISIGPDGTAYATGLGLGPSSGDQIPVTDVLAAVSRDGGKTWQRAQNITPSDTAVTGNDKPSVTADPTRRGVAFVTWNRAADTVFARTTNGGRSWSAPRVIIPGSGGGGTFDEEIVVAPRDVLYDIVARTVQTAGGSSSTARNSIAFVRSTDHGRTWSTLHDIAVIGYPNTIRRGLTRQIRPDDQPVGIRAGGPAPAGAVDLRSGTLFVVWTQDQGGPAGIALSRHAATAKHWSSPRLISPPGTFAFAPGVAVDGHGVVGVTYYTASSPDTPPVSTDYWLVLSRDGGVHFGRPIHLAGPFDLAQAPQSGGYFLGDYEGLAAGQSTFHALFVIVNNGTPENLTDVVSRSVTP